jgi:hypothetical protein
MGRVKGDKGLKTKDIIQGLVKLKLEQGLSTPTLLKYLMDEQGYETSYAYELLRDADKFIADAYRNWAVDALEIQLSSLNQQYQEAKLNKDKKLTLEITKEINKIKQLYVEKHIHSGSVEIKTKWDDDSDNNKTI